MKKKSKTKCYRDPISCIIIFCMTLMFGMVFFSVIYFLNCWVMILGVAYNCCLRKPDWVTFDRNRVKDVVFMDIRTKDEVFRKMEWGRHK